MADDSKSKLEQSNESKLLVSEDEDFSDEADVLTSEDSQEVLQKFDAFEVEDMPESNELQERRRKVKRRLQELEMGTLNSEEESPFPVEDGGILELLKEARITPRQLFSSCLFFLLLVGMAIFFFGSFSLSLPDWFSTENVEEDVDGSGSNVNEAGEEWQELSYMDESLLLGVLLGEGNEDTDQTTDIGEEIGSESLADEHLVQWIRDFSKLYESVGTDVNELLNEAPDRREALRSYTQELRALFYTAERDLDALRTEMDELSSQFSMVENLKDEEEARFFNQLRQLEGTGTNVALDAFIDYGQEAFRLRAHYLALEQLLVYFEQVLPFVQLKLKDIELNEEALVKGVKVIELNGSDLELIIDEEEL